MLTPEITDHIESRLAEEWPGTSLAGAPIALTGGFWASMYRVRLNGQPHDVPSEVVLRIAPDAAMGAKELAVQRAVADAGFCTPRVRLVRRSDAELGGTWSVMDFAAGRPPLGDLDGIGALAGARRLFARLPAQLAIPMARLHALDPAPVSAAVRAAAPTVAWRVEDLLGHFASGADALGRPDLVAAVQALVGLRPAEGPTVVCHGDLHPFNLLVHDGDVTVIDWTGALLAEPAYDVAFTAMLLANPPLDAPGPLRAVIRRVGAALARRFEAQYRASAEKDLGGLEWYRALHGIRVLVEAASLEARHGPGAGGHPFGALTPVAASTVTATTGVPVLAG
jgi:aminoglycoside phosphotransferase (APT) family kinase protein